MPATVMLRTSPYAGGTAACETIAHASRTCCGSSLMRRSMSSGSPARMRSTDSITEVSCVIVAMSGSSHHALARVEERRKLVARFGLRVDAYERLGPRKPDEQPRAVREEELRAVLRLELHDLRHGLAAQLLGRRVAELGHQAFLHTRVLRRAEVEIAPQVVRRPGHAHELGDELRRLLLRLQHEVEEEEVGNDA